MAREMKDSGIEWIDIIPETWKVNTIFQLFKQVKNKNEGLIETNLLSLSYGKIKRKNIETVSGLLPDSFDGYNIIEKDDIVIRLTDLQNDQKSLRVGLANERGIVTSAYITIRSISNNNPEYLYYYLHTFDVAKGFYGMGAGVRQGLNWNGLKHLQITIPPLAEQNRIADFLDRKCAEIDRVLEKTRASIEEYKKLKQSVITQAVTKGVRGEREMKDSGIEWFRQIPVDVNISRVGYYYNVILGKMICSQPQEGMTEYPYFCAANIHYSGIDYYNLKRMWFSSNEIETYAVRNGDLLVVEGGAGAGGCAIVKECNEVVGIQNSIQIVRPKHNHDIRYLAYLIQLLVKSQYIDVVCNKATIPHFTKDKLLTMPYLVFPINEQQEICNYLDKKCSEIDTLISKKEQFINELESYKKSLIYEYVTGKKEVQ